MATKANLDAALIIVKEAGKTAADYDRDVGRLRTIKTLEASIVATEADFIKRRQELSEARSAEVAKDKADRDVILQRCMAHDNAWTMKDMALRMGEGRFAEIKTQLRQLKGGLPPHPGVATLRTFDSIGLQLGQDAGMIRTVQPSAEVPGRYNFTEGQL